MKIYTSQVEQFGRKLFVANELVEFDKTGCAEVTKEVGEKILAYSTKYSEARPVVEKIEPKKATLESVIAESDLENYKLEVEKLKKANQSRKEKAERLEKEIEDVKEEMTKVVSERDEAVKRVEEIKEVHKQKVEELEYRAELAMLEVDELKGICAKLEIPEVEYAKKKSKKVLIDLITAQ